MSRFRALPYAKALFEVLRRAEPARVDRIVGELDDLATAVDAVPELLRVQVSPAVPSEIKTAILDRILDRMEVDETTRRFVHVVQGHYRLEHLRAIADAFRDLVDRHRGRARATVETAAPLADEERRALLEAMSALTGAEVVARFADRPELLAGFRARIGSLVFDGSLVGQVERLSRQTLSEQG